MLLKLSWRNLWRNRRRTLITMASVFFAVLISLFMKSMQRGAYERIIGNVVRFYSGYIQIHAQGYWDEQTLDNSLEDNVQLLKTIQAHPDVQAFTRRLESFALASNEEHTKPCLVVGIDPEQEQSLTGLKNKLVSGSYLEPNTSAVMMGEGLASRLNLELGDTLVLIGMGYHGASAAGKYPVSGLLKFGSPDLNKMLVYLPLEKAQELYAAEGRLTGIVINVQNPDVVIPTAQALQAGLGEAYESLSWEEMMPELVQLMKADRVGDSITLGILYMIVAFGIFGTVLMMTAERRHEFGVMLAVGMKRRLLASMVFWETIFIALGGVLMGALCALPIIYYFNRNPIYLGDEVQKMYDSYGIEAVFPTAIKMDIFLSETLTVFIIASIVALYPVLRLYKLEPIAAMRK